MARDVVEVVARFGDTVLDYRHLGASDVYRIGTGPDVDLALPGHTSFPLVDRGTVRIPVGIAATTRGTTTRFAIGLVSIAITRVKLAKVHVPRKRPDWRPPAYLLGSLLAQPALWFAAVTLEPFERLHEKQLPRFRFVHIAPLEVPPEKLPDKAKAPEAAQAAAAASQQHDKREHAQGDKGYGASIAEAVARAGKIDAL